ncbi:MAG TPA: isoprenylcysteine carboxylmethyltransferase family protein [Terriglobales bacterium]
MSGLLISDYFWMVFAAVWVIWALRTKRVRSREDIGQRLSHRPLTIAGFWLLLFPFLVPLPGWFQKEIIPSWLKGTGILLSAIGIGFAIWARIYLGGNWSSSVTVKVEHQLIRSGPYRWVRHPIYTGMVLAALGTALELGEVRGLIAVPLIYLGFKIKSKIEERMMRRTFGAQYDDYSAMTGGIVPRI